MFLYGDVSSCFSELFKDYTLFNLVPNVGSSGYKERIYKGSIRGYIQYKSLATDEVTASMRVGNIEATLYAVSGDYKPMYGDSLEDKRRVFTIHGFSDYENEAGFIVCLLELVHTVIDQNVVEKDYASQVFEDFNV